MTATTRLTARRFRLEAAVPGRQAADSCARRWLIAVNEVSAASRSTSVKGMVVSVNAPAKSFVVSHERIAGLMDAMTMSFDVRQATDLRDIVPGAVVEFTLVVGDSTSYATRITVRRYQTAEQDPSTARRLSVMKRMAGLTTTSPVAIGAGRP